MRMSILRSGRLRPMVRRFPGLGIPGLKFLGLGFLVLAGCGAPEKKVGPPSARLTGTVAYRERIAMMPGATLHVKLVDYSRADTAVTISERTLFPEKNVPVPFELLYDPAAILPGNVYGIEAQLAMDGKNWRNGKRFRVLTGGAGTHVDVLMEMGP